MNLKPCVSENLNKFLSRSYPEIDDANFKGAIEFFTVYAKLSEMALLASKDLTTAKEVTSSGARPDARDYYWFMSPMPNQMS